MRKRKILAEISSTYFDQNLDIRIQFYNLLTIIGMVTGTVVAVIAALLKEHMMTVILDLSVAVLSFILLNIAEKKKNYHVCSWVMIIAVFMIMFPVLFFYCGGYKCGVSCYFVLAIVLTAHILEKRERTVAIALEFVLYITCCVITYYKPDITASLQSEYIYIVDVTINFVIASVLLLLTVTLRSRMINARQSQMREMNRELMARNTTLAQYDQMKSDFLATVAHEINTPLAVIAAAGSDTIDLLKESPLNIDEIVENQIIIGRRVKLIDSIVLDLMDTVAIENGRLSLYRRLVSLPELIENVCDAQYKKLNTNGNSIEYDFQPGMPLIWADPARIEQVMTNLLTNSFRHTTNGMVTIKLTKTDNTQVVSVTDNGEGMDAQMARTALKQYVSTKADYWRHGIGLFICRRIITAHGGEIWIDSEKGRGTTVSFSLREEHDYE